MSPDMAASPDMAESYEYDAFICYRRSDGQVVARRLRRRLLDYQLPASFGPADRSRLEAVFLDTIHEQATENFFENSILPALRASSRLIVIQTPGAREPRPNGQPNWVQREIDYFLSLPQGQNILVALAAGESTDPLPGGLAERFPHPQIVDLRGLNARVPISRKSEDGILTLLGSLLNIPAVRMSELRGEEERLRAARRLRWGLLSLAVLLLMIALSLVAVLRRRSEVRALADDEVKSAASLVGTGRADQALAHLARALRLVPEGVPAQSLLTEVLLERSWPRPITEFREDGAETIFLSDDGRQFATVSEDGAIRVRDTRTFQQIGTTITQEDQIQRLQMSRGGARILGYTTRWHLWDVRTGRLLLQSRLLGQPRLGAVSPDGHWLVEDMTLSPDGRWLAEKFYSLGTHTTFIRIREIDAERLFEIRLPDNASYAFSPDSGKLLAQSSLSSTVWRFIDGRKIRVPTKDGAAFTPDSRRLVTWGRGGALWDAASGELLQYISHQDRWVFHLRISPDGKRILTVDFDGREAQIWSFYDSAQPLARIQIGERVFNADLSGDGQLLLIQSATEVTLWDADTGKSMGKVFCDCSSARFLAGTRLVVTSDRGGFLRIWSFEPARMGTELLHSESSLPFPVFSEDASRLAVTVGSEIHILDTDSGRPVGAQIRGGEGSDVRLSPDGRFLMAVNSGIRVWDTRSGRLLWDLPASAAPVKALAMGPRDFSKLSPGGRTLAVLRRDASEQFRVVDLWDLETGRRMGSLPHKEWVYDFKLDSPGDRIATASADGTVRIWSSPGGTALVSLPEHEGGAVSLDFSADGEWIATGTTRGEAWIWDAQSGERLVGPLRSPGLRQLTFESRDQRLLAWGQRSISLWDARTGHPVGGALHQKTPVVFGQLSPDGARLMVQSIDDSIQFLNPSTGQPFRAPIKFEFLGYMPTARLGPKGGLLWLALTDQVHVVAVPVFSRRDGDLLARWAEAVGGYTLNEEGQPVPLIDQIRRLQDLRRETAGASPDRLTAASMIRWFLSDPGMRPLSPVINHTVKEYMRQHMVEGTTEARQEAASAFPGHPLLRKYWYSPSPSPP